MNNLENLVAAMIPGGIEMQEKAGQLREASKQTLPQVCPKEHFERLGFGFHEKVDKIFYRCTFPKGWTKRPTEHSMWTDLVDPQGVVRGKIFFKAAFYDYRAHAHLLWRYEPTKDWDDEASPWTVWDLKTSSSIFTPTARDYEGSREECLRWLEENKPHHLDPLAYWDDL